MAGELVPLVMVPRFTTYVGAGTYLTVPLRVENYQSVKATFWRGKLVGDPMDGAGFNGRFETSDDAEVWTTAGSGVTTPEGATLIEFDMTVRWVRFKLTLTADTTHVVALTTWVVGFLEVREQN